MKNRILFLLFCFVTLVSTTIGQSLQDSVYIRTDQVGKHAVPIYLTGTFFWEEPGKHEHADKLSIREIYPGILYYKQWYDVEKKQHTGYKEGSGIFSPKYPIKYVPSVWGDPPPPRQRTVPWKYEFYDESGKLQHTFDIGKQWPYSEKNYPNIDCEYCFDGESGFGTKDQRAAFQKTGKAPMYRTIFTGGIAEGGNGYVYLLYELNAHTSLGPWIGNRQTLILLDSLGNEKFRLKDTDMDIWHVLITPDEKYVVLNIGVKENINNIFDKAPEGLVIIETQTGKEIYREYAENALGTYGWAWMRNGFIMSAIVYQYSQIPDYSEHMTIFDLSNKTYYKRIFTETERQEYLHTYVYKYGEANMFNHLLNAYQFHNFKF